MFRSLLKKISLTICCLTLACQPSIVGMQSSLNDQAIPDFKRAAIDGSAVDITAFQGKVLVVKFFAKYCEPCKRTLPLAQKVHQEMGNQVVVIGIAEDELLSDVLEVVQKYQVTFPVVHDNGNILLGRFRVRELPITFVADKAGIVRWVGGPEQGDEDLIQMVESLK